MAEIAKARQRGGEFNARTVFNEQKGYVSLEGGFPHRSECVSQGGRFQYNMRLVKMAKD